MSGGAALGATRGASVVAAPLLPPPAEGAVWVQRGCRWSAEFCVERVLRG